MVRTEKCNFSRTTSARENLAKYKVHCIDIPSTCDHGLKFDPPVPPSQVYREEEFIVKDMLLKEYLDCVCQSCASCPSPDQLGHASCVSTALPM